MSPDDPTPSPEGPTSSSGELPSRSSEQTPRSGASAPGSEESVGRATASVGSLVVDWLRTTDWLWMIIGGFYEVGYLFWYVPALAELPRSVRDPPEQFPWHWPLDFVATALSGAALLFLGFRRATALAEDSGGGSQDGRSRGRGSGDRDSRDRNSRDDGSRGRDSLDRGSRGAASSPGGDPGAE